MRSCTLQVTCAFADLLGLPPTLMRSDAGTVYVVENYGVFVAGEGTGSLKRSRREGRRVLLRAIDDVERRFSEPVFSRTSTFLRRRQPILHEANRTESVIPALRLCSAQRSFAGRLRGQL